MDGDNFARLIYLSALILLVGPAVLIQFRQDVPKALRNIGIWVVIIALLAIGYVVYRDYTNGSNSEYINQLDDDSI